MIVLPADVFSEWKSDKQKVDGVEVRLSREIGRVCFGLSLHQLRFYQPAPHFTGLSTVNNFPKFGIYNISRKEIKN